MRHIIFILTTIILTSCSGKQVIEKYKSGQNMATYSVNSDNQKHGHYTTYFENGQKRSEGEYVNGKQIGVWNCWYENGAQVNIGNYGEDGLETGEWKFFYPSGKLQQINHFAHGKANGEFIDYYESGKIKRKGNTTNEILNGADKEFYEDGILSNERIYKNGVLDGAFKEYATNGKIVRSGNWNDSVPIGDFYEYDTLNGNILQKTFIYKGGKPSDTTITYKDNKPCGKLIY